MQVLVEELIITQGFVTQELYFALALMTRERRGMVWLIQVG